MDILNLPTKLSVNGKEFAINYDFKTAITIMNIFENTDLTDFEKIEVMVGILFIDDIVPCDMNEAAKIAIWFLNAGDIGDAEPSPYGRLYSWEQDGRFIISAVDKVLGRSCRKANIHWWEFMSAFYEIGECTFTTIIYQRKLKKRGKQSEEDKRWWNENIHIAKLKEVYTDEETEALQRFEKLLEGGE